MKLSIPEMCLVLLVGPSGAGKSTFARRHFRDTEIISSDHCRALVSDDENDQSATPDAFDVVHLLAERRLARGRLTVIDATNLLTDARRPLLGLARRFHVQAVAIVLDFSHDWCLARNADRPEREVGAAIVRQHVEAMDQARRQLPLEGFRRVFTISAPEQLGSVEMVRERLPVDRREERGPFDIIGDVHGCFAELQQLLERLGYRLTESPAGLNAIPPAGRKAVFVGDLVDRGPDSPRVLQLVMGMVAAGTGFCVMGNHDYKLMRKLWGRDVSLSPGLRMTLEQLDRHPPEVAACVRRFLENLPSHLVLDGGALVVAHAGIKAPMQGRVSGRVRDFCLYGETTGEVDELGLPVRLDWTTNYRGSAAVVYGHTTTREPRWVNHTICIDTGCVFGGHLAALRYPEREIIQVAAAQVYFRSAHAFPESAPPRSTAIEPPAE